MSRLRGPGPVLRGPPGRGLSYLGRPQPGDPGGPDPRPAAPFSRSRIGVFFQGRPRLRDPYRQDPLLRAHLRARLPPQVFAAVHEDLQRFGELVAEEVDALGRECELCPPSLQQYDAWGRRVDRIVTSPAWRRMKDLAAHEGLVAEAFERRFSNWSRVYQMAKLYLFVPSSGLFSCPLAMTDGAAKVLETVRCSGPPGAALAHLTSRDPQSFWTSGQWMTERKGGSDVALGTETLARAQADGTYRLYGHKWFTSATDADVTLTLARVVDDQNCVKEGTRGLTLFFLKLRDEQGRLNGIEVQRLKDKLGTRQMPTAELLLDGAEAYQISAEGRGVATIAKMLAITRIHNVISAVASMRRIVNLARDYASKRFVFGKLIKDHPLHTQTLARMEVETRGGFLLAMELARLLGLEETHQATPSEERLLRLLPSVAKLYTGKQAVAVVSEGLECFGGQGYMEDTGLAGLLRDTQVLTIWEGTTNILALDVLQAQLKSEGQVLRAFASSVQEKLDSARERPALAAPGRRLQDALRQLHRFLEEVPGLGGTAMETAARDWAYSLARIYIGALLVEHAASSAASPTDVYAAQRWCERDLCPTAAGALAGCYSQEAVSMDAALVYEGSPLLDTML
ncbi:acyl-CoA dehydrogenase family member 11-like [Ornithorhynchus anatinus]|uniref:acyl-CoA dehydrogenase family member 11-like n=1 Tax=Ornithorhynchus anatinus TaxID=9258 RepID=UPI0010A7D325|nr:acyl-CoA dehydrogenase family member 11-like [Ornithorhynchus anatinus]